MKYKLLCLVLIFPYLIYANSKENKNADKYPATEEGLKFSPDQLILPGVLLSLGIYGTLDNNIDKNIQKQIAKWDGNTIADDILVFLPGASVYLLDWCGIPSKHNLLDKTVITVSSAILTVGSSFILKSVTSVERPDGSNNHSFPSMHTAIAFAGAELIRQEYGDLSVWYGIGGYTIASGVGFLRMYNNKHWLSDVLAGAGLGILSTKSAYWLYPSIRKLYKNKNQEHLSLLPYGSSSELGVRISFRF